MVNDITTLNGSLMELGETLATNITAKGVSASASDGLTTLANKVLQISGGGGGTTVLIDDDCSTTPSSSDYGTSKRMTDGQASTCQLTYDSTNQCYKLTGSGNNISGLPVIALNSKDDVTLRVKFKLSNANNYCQLILAVTPDLSNNTAFYGVRQMNGTFQHFYDYGNGGGNASDSTSISNITSQWHYLELKRSGTDLTCKIYDDSMSSLASFSKTIPSWNDCYYLIGRNTENTSYYALIDEVYAEQEGGTPTNPCEQYQTEINNAIEYINGSGS